MKNICHIPIALLLIMVATSLQGQPNSLGEEDFVISNFEDLELQPNSFWNGSDLSGGFISGILFFPNAHNPAWGSWSGWSYSNMADDSTAGWLNQYSAITAAGYDPELSGGSNYGVAYVPIDWADNENIPIAVNFDVEIPRRFKGLYVTNSTYAALAMEFGDGVSKKFGGNSGNDPDYFKLILFGYINGIATDTIDFYLADYRFEDNNLDYIVKTWEWVELSDLGLIDSLMFTLESSDVGTFGMNTPAYFCVDHLHIYPEEASNIFHHQISRLKIYPNPASDFISLKSNLSANSKIEIVDLSGRLIKQIIYTGIENTIDVRDLKVGNYVIKIRGQKNISTGTFIINE
jgi:hypothetical protein